MKKISLKDKIIGIAFMILMAGCEKKIIPVADTKDDDSSTVEEQILESEIPPVPDDDSDLWWLIVIMGSQQY